MSTSDDLETGEVSTRDFYVPIGDAYCFRSMIEFMCVTLLIARFHITRDKIYACEKDSNDMIIHELEIYTCMLVDFFLDDAYESFVLPVTMRKFKQSIKNAQKRMNQLVFFNNKETRDREFHAIFANPGKKANGRARIELIQNLPDNIETIDVSDFDYPQIPNKEENEYVHTLYVSDLSRSFASVCNTKCDYVELQCYEKGFLASGYKDGNVSGAESLGNVVDPMTAKNKQQAIENNGPLICKYIIMSDVIKPFGKINNISGENATLRIYFSPDKNLKIVFPIASIGVYRCFIASVDPQTMALKKLKKK